jgi:hypothetical protein
MDNCSSFKFAPPQHLYDSYKCIKNINLITKKLLDDENIYELQEYLNLAQPKNEDESAIRSLVQYFYRKNPVNFCKFLVHSRLNHLILWTEAKCIVRHFGLQGVVYIKWDEGKYHCSLHQNVNMNKQSNVLNSFSNDSKNFSNVPYNRERSSNRHRPRQLNTDYSSFSKNRRPSTPENSPRHNTLTDSAVVVNKSYSESVKPNTTE